jgi:hypothetical protein
VKLGDEAHNNQPNDRFQKSIELEGTMIRFIIPLNGRRPCDPAALEPEASRLAAILRSSFRRPTNVLSRQNPA